MNKFIKIVSVFLVAIMCLGLVACSGSGSKKSLKDLNHKKKKKERVSDNIKALDYDEVEDILEDDLGLRKDDDYRTNSSKDLDSFSGEFGKAYFSIVIYDDEDDAADYFEDIFDYYEDDLEDDCLDGKFKTKLGKTSGYILLNGEGADDGDMIMEDEYYYGGIYYADNMVIRVFAQKDKDSAREDVDDFCKSFGLPRP